MFRAKKSCPKPWLCVAPLPCNWPNLFKLISKCEECCPLFSIQPSGITKIVSLYFVFISYFVCVRLSTRSSSSSDPLTLHPRDGKDWIFRSSRALAGRDREWCNASNYLINLAWKHCYGSGGIGAQARGSEGNSTVWICNVAEEFLRIPEFWVYIVFRALNWWLVVFATGLGLGKIR